MALAIVYIGRFRSTHDSATGVLADDSYRGQIFAPTSQALWVEEFGTWAGRIGATGGCRVGLHRVAGGKLTSLVGYSSLMDLDALMVGNTGGQQETAPVAVWNEGTYRVLLPGSSLGLALLAGAGGLRHGMVVAGDVTGYDERFFTDPDAGDLPITPFDSSIVGVIEGVQDVWVKTRVNEPPRVPVDRSPSGDISDLTPTFVSTFRDRNGRWGPLNDGTDTGDELNRYQIQLKNRATGAIIWNHTTNAGPSQKAADETSITYPSSGVPSLVFGGQYSWIIRHMDQAGEWGDYADWLDFDVISQGQIVGTGPTNQQNTQSPNFTGTWTHDGGLAMTSVRVRLKQGALVIDQSGDVTKAVVSGNGFSVSRIEAGFDLLDWGENFTVEFQGRDSNNVWMGSWSTPQAFWTDFAPSIPSQLSPDGTVHTILPLLACTCADADDTVGTGFAVFAETIDAGSVVRGPFAMALKSGSTTEWELQTTATHVPSLGAYEWRAYGFDGTLYSGEQTTAVAATRSAPASFTYAAGPAVTILFPAAGIDFATSTPNVSWSTTGQAQKRVEVIRVADGVTVYDSNWIVSVSTTQPVPSGKITGNGDAFDFRVTVRNASLLEGQDTNRATLVYIPEPAVENFDAVPYTIPGDPYPTTIRMTWTPPGTIDSEFIGYRIYRSDAPGEHAFLPGPETDVYLDYFPPSHQELTYTIVQVVDRDGAEIEGLPATGAAEVTISGFVIHAVDNPASERLVSQVWREIRDTADGRETRIVRWSGGAPRRWRRPDTWWHGFIDFQLNDLVQVSGRDAILTIRILQARGGPLIFRDRYETRTMAIVREGGVEIERRHAENAFDVRMLLEQEDI